MFQVGLRACWFSVVSQLAQGIPSPLLCWDYYWPPHPTDIYMAIRFWIPVFMLVWQALSPHPLRGPLLNLSLDRWPFECLVASQEFSHKKQQDLVFLIKRSSWLLGELDGRETVGLDSGRQCGWTVGLGLGRQWRGRFWEGILSTNKACNLMFSTLILPLQSFACVYVGSLSLLF